MAKNIKYWYQSITVWLAFIQAAAGIVSVLTMEYPEVGILLLFKSGLDILVRFLTVKPVTI